MVIFLLFCFNFCRVVRVILGMERFFVGLVMSWCGVNGYL